MDKVDEHFFQAIVVIMEINIAKAEIKGIAQIGVKIKSHKSYGDHGAKDQPQNGNDHGPIGGAGALDAFSASAAYNAEKGKENAEKHGKTAENGNDGHDPRYQSGKR